VSNPTADSGTSRAGSAISAAAGVAAKQVVAKDHDIVSTAAESQAVEVRIGRILALSAL
jgi:hypothetical protein